jgi:hypothetical protein
LPMEIVGETWNGGGGGHRGGGEEGGRTKVVCTESTSRGGKCRAPKFVGEFSKGSESAVGVNVLRRGVGSKTERESEREALTKEQERNTHTVRRTSVGGGGGGGGVREGRGGRRSGRGSVTGRVQCHGPGGGEVRGREKAGGGGLGIGTGAGQNHPTLDGGIQPGGEGGGGGASGGGSEVREEVWEKLEEALQAMPTAKNAVLFASIQRLRLADERHEF